MRKIYISSDFKCHVEDDGSMTEIETNFFDGKCDAYIEGFMYVPEGAQWVREDGRVFNGEMITACEDYATLRTKQRAYEVEQLADMKAALELLGVTIDE